jgi:hypothetical protein
MDRTPGGPVKRGGQRQMEDKEGKRKRMKDKRNQIRSERWREHNRVEGKQSRGRIEPERGREIGGKEESWEGMMQ